MSNYNHKRPTNSGESRRSGSKRGHGTRRDTRKAGPEGGYQRPGQEERQAWRDQGSEGNGYWEDKGNKA